MKLKKSVQLLFILIVLVLLMSFVYASTGYLKKSEEKSSREMEKYLEKAHKYLEKANKHAEKYTSKVRKYIDKANQYFRKAGRYDIERKCSNYCAPGTTRCVGNHYQLCTDTDWDGCNEWLDIYNCELNTADCELVACKKGKPIPIKLKCEEAGGACKSNNECTACIDATGCDDDECCCVMPKPEGTRVLVSKESAYVGERVEVIVSVADVEDLFGFQFDIQYDSSILELVDVNAGNFLTDGGKYETFCVDPDIDSLGWIRNFACSIKESNEGVSGSGILAEIVFEAIVQGASPIKIHNVKLSDSNAQEIPALTVDGEVVVGGQICVDQCGDGPCQEIVCHGPGCPCAETPQDCPQDCGTCQSQGYACCDSCQLSPHQELDSDCAGQVCCEICAATGKETLTLVPSNYNPPVGGTIGVAINVNSIQDLMGAQMNFNFDSSRLQYQDMSTGDFLDSCPVTPTVDGSTIKNLACIALGSGKSGSGTLMALTFTTTASGSASFSLTDVKLVNSDSQEISPVTTGDTTIKIG